MSHLLLESHLHRVVVRERLRPPSEEGRILRVKPGERSRVCEVEIERVSTAISVTSRNPKDINVLQPGRLIERVAEISRIYSGYNGWSWSTTAESSLRVARVVHVARGR